MTAAGEWSWTDGWLLMAVLMANDHGKGTLDQVIRSADDLERARAARGGLFTLPEKGLRWLEQIEG